MTLTHLHRWHVTITYRTADGETEVDHAVEEISELHDIVERGPSFYTIKDIHIVPAPRCEPLTVEQAAAS